MLLFQFIVFNVLNVVIQTIKSIATIKCGKMLAAIVNAVAYGLYTYIIILTNVELDLWIKIMVVAIANLVGVYVVKLIEEKSRKDKLWEIRATLPHDEYIVNQLKIWGELNHIPYNYIDINKYYVVNIYCATQNQSALTKEFLTRFNAKYFVSESKVL